jgi:hypothetical protein
VKKAVNQLIQTTDTNGKGASLALAPDKLTAFAQLKGNEANC